MRINTINNHCVAVYTPVNYGVKLETSVFSYNTEVLRIDANNGLHRLWSGWSVTTQRDINKACPGLHMTKAQWDAMPIE